MFDRGGAIMKIVFMGTPDFARESLEKVYNAGYDIELVITNQDKPKGRGMKLCPSPVKEFAIEKGIKVCQPLKIKESIDEIKNINPDLIIVVAYGKIIPNKILEIPRLGTINVHGSLLPKYRGAAPIQWAVINGEKITGVTTMYINEQMDAGDVILKQEVEIGDYETLGEVWKKLSKVGADLLLETLKQIENGTAPRVPQTGEPTYAPMLSKDIAKIDWQNMNATKIKDLVRGLNPIMGAYSYLNGEKVKFWKTKVVSINDFVERINEFEEFKNRLYGLEPGTIVFSDEKQGLFVKAKEDILQIEELQVPNNRKMNASDYLRGNPIQAGMIFE